MTCFTIMELFKKNFSYENLDNAVTVMECIVATHISSKKDKIISLPLNKKFHNTNINFA